MTDISGEIKNTIYKAVLSNGYSISEEEILVERPQNEGFGDYATTIAMILAKKRKEDPRDIALSIVGKIPQGKNSRFIEKAEVVAGYINLRLKKEWLFAELKRVIREGDKYGFTDGLKGQKIMVEFTDPNPFKEIHIGHFFSNAVGESIARLFETTGAIVKRANYQGDVGMHVAKAVWGMRKKLKEEGITLRQLADKPLSERVHFMGQAYALGAKAYKEDKSVAEEIRDYNYLCYIASQKRLEREEGWRPVVNYTKYIEGKNLPYKEVEEIYIQGRKWSLEHFEEVYKILGTKFDYYFFESLAGEFGRKFVEENLKRGIFERSKGAIVYKGEKKGLHTRVFVNSRGLPTYEAKDLGLAVLKYERFKYDKSIIVTGNEVNEYFRVVLSALCEINPDLAKKTIHIGHGMLRLPTGKMSSRTGKVLTAEWLINEIKAYLVNILKQRGKGRDGFPEEDLNKIAVGAAKYAILKSNVKKDIIFDFEKTLSFEGNSGPYLQYTYVRAKSILREAEEDILKKSLDEDIDISALFTAKEEDLLLRAIYRFPEVVKGAVGSIEPHRICNYIFDLSQKFSSFYDKHPVLRAENESIKKGRLLLVAAVATVIKNSLRLLGIDTVEKM